MAVSNDFINYVVDQFSNWGEVTVRRMFGGAGLYRDGKMFGLVADDVVYLKVDESNREDFVRAGASPFRPVTKKGKSTVMPYYEIPVDVLEDQDELANWAGKALLVALNTKPKQ